MKIEIEVPVPEGWKYKSDTYTLIGNNIKELWIKGEIVFERVEPADTELEEAKKLIGKWVKNDRNNNAMKVTRVYRDEHCGDIVYANESSSASAKYWKPFPLPVWRCCASDKPKRDGLYLSRHKIGKHKHTCRFLNGAFTCRADSNYEWLDEGER